MLIDNIKYIIYKILDRIDSGYSFTISDIYFKTLLLDLFLKGYNPLLLLLVKHNIDTIYKERIVGNNSIESI